MTALPPLRDSASQCRSSGPILLTSSEGSSCASAKSGSGSKRHSRRAVLRKICRMKISQAARRRLIQSLLESWPDGTE